MSYKESLSPSKSWVWTTCKRRYSLKYHERVKPLVRNQLLESWLRLFRGQVIHAGIEAGFLGHSVEQYIERALNEELAKGLSDEQKAEIDNLRFESTQIVQNLLDWLPASDWQPYRHNGVPMIEAEVRAPIAGFDGGFMGYVDLVAVHKPTGALWVLDWKSKASFGGDDDIDYNTQLPYYLKALRHMGIEAHRFALIDIKSTLPKRAPRKLRVDSESIDGIRESADGCFRWVPRYCSDTYINNLWRHLEIQARSMAAFKPEWGYVSRSPFSCKGCEFRQICDAELAGDDVKHVVNTHFSAPAGGLRVLMEE